MTSRGHKRFRHPYSFQIEIYGVDHLKMVNNCSCFSCEKFRNWNKIDFLKKREETVTENEVTQRQSSDIDHSSIAQFDRLPDEVLIRILECISPTNIEDFITLISLEIVSKRIRRCVVDNKKIWEKATELVVGGRHPDLPRNHYLCHIGHFSLKLFLQRVPKITKVVVSADKYWLCDKMMENQILPTIDHFIGKFEIQELIVCQSHRDFSVDLLNGSLIQKLTENAKQSLETYQFSSIYADFYEINHMKFGRALANCVNLRNVRMCTNKARPNLQHFLDQLKSIQSLEISRYADWDIHNLRTALTPFTPPFQLQTLRFTSLYGGASNQSVLHALKALLSVNNASSIRELELHHCVCCDDLAELPHLLDGVSYLTHFKLTFLPCFKVNKTPKIVQFLRNNIHMKAYEMKISITFKHSDVDREDKLAIVHSLFDAYDVPHMSEQEDTWEFIRGMVCINLNLEKIRDESLICHLGAKYN